MAETFSKLAGRFKQRAESLAPGALDSATSKVPMSASLGSSSRRSIKDRMQKFAEQESEFAEQDKAEAAQQRSRTEMYAESAAYHAALKRKYMRAAARPWWSIEPDPPPPDAAGRGSYFSERGHHSRASAAYEEAIRLDPEDYVSLNALAWLLATCPEAKLRDGKRAVELATRACDLTSRNDAGLLDTLAAAHAEAGNFEAAVEIQREALAFLSQADPNLDGFRARLDAYKANQAYREAPKKGQ